MDIVLAVDTHVLLVDLRPKRLTGNVAEAAGTGRYHLQQKRSAVRSRKADDHVRDRLGTPAGTTRGFGVANSEIGNLIGDVLDATGQNSDQSSRTENTVREQVRVLCDRFPIY